jgi:uncharacterized membrane protein HdeD (DUF308 family)
VIVFGAYAIVDGVAAIGHALQLRRLDSGWGSLLFQGIVSAVLTLLFGILLGILTLITPGATMLSLIWIVGVYAILFGAMFIVAAFQLRRGLAGLVSQNDRSAPTA